MDTAANVSLAPARIFLVGMMGAGKTTVGRALAEQLAIPFVDLDEEITARTRQTIPEIFAQHGELNFRACEAHILRDLPRRFPIGVLAVGGGAPAHFHNLRFMNANGLTVWLTASTQSLVARLADARDGRPLLAGDDWRARIAALVEERAASYRGAQARVETDGFSVSDVVSEIVAALPQVTGH